LSDVFKNEVSSEIILKLWK